MKQQLWLASLCVLLVAHTHAATPEAWTEHKKAVLTSCMKASQLKQSRPASGLIEYSDQLGLTAVLLSGRYPQPHMKNQSGRELCLYDKKSRAAFVSEADSIRGASPSE